MSRIIWKGAISFGLVNIPVVLKPASRSHTLDLDMLDKRDMAPIGYQRINKHTGKPVESDDIVKGYAYEKDEYVVLSDEDFKQANVEATQTVDIVSFVDADKIPPYYFETPYYLEPDKRGERGYALLHETMRRTGRAALAMVVLRNRQHLAALLVFGKALVLNTMRFADEVLPIEELNLPKGKQGATAREVDMAEKLVEDMSEDWAPEQFRDTYRDDLMALIDAKIKAGKTHLLTPASEEGEAPAKGAKVIDMMALLRESLGKRGKRAERATAEEKTARDETADDAPAGKTAKAESRSRAATRAAGKKAPAKRAPARKAATKRAATRKTAADKVTAKKVVAKKVTAKKVTAKKAAAKKAAPGQAAPR
ncbi:MAG: Ku protein, partial [Cupriavidus sp.]